MSALAPVRRHWFPLFVVCAAAAALLMLPSAYSGEPSQDHSRGVSASAVVHARHAVAAARLRLAHDRAAGASASVLASDHVAVTAAQQHLSDAKAGAHVASPAPSTQTTAQMAAAAMAAQAYEQYYSQQPGQQGQPGQLQVPGPVQKLLDREMAIQRQLPLFDSVAFEKTFVNTRDHLTSDAQNPPTTPTGAADAVLTPLGEGLAIEGISYLPGMVGQLQRSVDRASQ